ncbi:hypothetical protein BCV72DRAFT_311239 [Rhizopus microsporus var. microsporus]|uniref:Uncharacterized protein n=1 Tax=Rhizopus microsporus var. microsporus TaxID=86635 RepID=A0A1X0RFI9_RHIZD|nr:hypothetical protein BCV72DRAFT_311239 [Rhizopus microsporus var. microsporus]
MSRSIAFGGGFIGFLIINTFNLDILYNRFLNDDFACSLFALCKLSLLISHFYLPQVLEPFPYLVGAFSLRHE